MDATKTYMQSEAKRLVAEAKRLAGKGLGAEANASLRRARKLGPATFKWRLSIGDIDGAAEIGDQAIGAPQPSDGYGLKVKTSARVVRLPKKPHELRVLR